MEKLGRFLVVGTLCTVLGLIIIWVLTGLLGIHYLVSTFVVFLTVNPIGYLLHRQFTFGSTSPHWIKQILRYYAVTASSLFSTLVLSALLVDGIGLHYLLANGVVAVAMVTFNFVSHGSWTFRPAKQPNGGSP